MVVCTAGKRGLCDSRRRRRRILDDAIRLQHRSPGVRPFGVSVARLVASSREFIEQRAVGV
jgi:hypothetical protein